MVDMSQLSSDNTSLTSDNSNLSLGNVNLVNDSLFLVNQVSDCLSEDSSLLDNGLDGFRSDWFWNWSTHSSDGFLDVDDLVNQFLHNVSQVDNSLLDDNSLWFFLDSWKFVN